MVAPAEYLEAVTVYRLCQAYQSLPSTGGVLDQDVSIIRMHAILNEGGYFEDAPMPAGTSDPLASLPMESL